MARSISSRPPARIWVVKWRGTPSSRHGTVPVTDRATTSTEQSSTDPRQRHSRASLLQQAACAARSAGPVGDNFSRGRLRPRCGDRARFSRGRASAGRKHRPVDRFLVEVAHGIAAEQREPVRLGEIVPEDFELDRFLAFPFTPHPISRRRQLSYSGGVSALRTLSQAAANRKEC